MPPEMMARVMPRAMMPTGALLRRMFSQLVSRDSSSAPTPSPSKLAIMIPVWTMIIKTSTSPVLTSGFRFQASTRPLPAGLVNACFFSIVAYSSI